MDVSAVKAEFARNIAEAHIIMANLAAINDHLEKVVDQSSQRIEESRAVLKSQLSD